MLVHDGARPFVSPGLVSRVVEGALRHGAAIPALPVVDALKRVEGELEYRRGILTAKGEPIHLVYRRVLVIGAYAMSKHLELTDKKTSNLFADASRLLDRIIDEQWLQAKAVFGFFPAHSEDDDLLVYADDKKAAGA